MIGVTDRVGLAYAKETVWGEEPSTTPKPTLAQLRYTGEDLSFNVSYQQSGEIEPSAQDLDIVQQSAEAGGSFNFEFSAGAFDDFIEAVLMAGPEDKTVVDVASSQLTFTAATKTIATASPGELDALAPGMFIRVSGCAEQANNAIMKVLTVAADVVTVDAALADETPAAAVLSGTVLRNGRTQHSFLMEKRFSDLDMHQAFRGVVPTGWNLDLSSGSFLTGSFSLMGKDAYPLSAESVGQDEPTPAPLNPVMNAGHHISNLEDGAGAMTELIESLSLAVTSNPRGRTGLATFGNASIGHGKFQVTGSMSVYFASEALFNRYLDNQETALSFRLADDAGNAYVISLPRIKFESGKVNAGGSGQDLMGEYSWRALKCADGYTMQVCFFQA